MDPVNVSVIVSAPRERVFDYLQDIANHAEFTDHFLTDWHLTRIDPVGRGAGARFRIKAPGPGGRFAYGDVTFTEVERPHKIVEVGRTGKNNRIRTLGIYELTSSTADSTRVSFTFQSIPDKLSDKILEGIGARGWLLRKNKRAMHRLRSILETGEGRGARVTVAGG
ncbi:MAG TPA: SRPBCC family protein [Solirubrobacteraceae bacterium]|nr:SRPBCC family protein [Solirubrobacteraceae bacterium]